MKKRCNLYIEEDNIEYLHEKNINISQLIDTLLAFYVDLLRKSENEIVEYRKRLSQEVIDKKTKRRLERAKNRENQQQRALEEEKAPQAEEANDVMSRIAVLCQENRWREAVLTARQALAEAENGEENENSEFVLPLTMAVSKLEMSLKRQMAAAFLNKAEEMLKKEYLLDVGEQ